MFVQISDTPVVIHLKHSGGFARSSFSSDTLANPVMLSFYSGLSIPFELPKKVIFLITPPVAGQQVQIINALLLVWRGIRRSDQLWCRLFGAVQRHKYIRGAPVFGHHPLAS